MHPARVRAPSPHVGLCVRDLARSRHFYVELLGFLWDSALVTGGPRTQQLLRVPGCERLDAEYLWQQGFCLELLAYASPGVLPHPQAPSNALGLDHLTFEVRDLAAVLARLRENGAQILEERLLPSAEAPRIAFVRDPDGELLCLQAQNTGGPPQPGRARIPNPHLALVVSDLERSTRFYRDVLGLLFDRRAELTGSAVERLIGLTGARIEAAVLWRAGFCLELMTFPTPGVLPRRGGPMNQLGWTHLSFQVEDLPATIAACRAFGVEVMDDTIVPSAEQPYALFLRDPDGQLIELIQL